jgi:hypothetical protein
MRRIRFVALAFISFLTALIGAFLTPGTFLHRALSIATCTVFSFNSTLCAANLARSSERVIAANPPAVVAQGNACGSGSVTQLTMQQGNDGTMYQVYYDFRRGQETVNSDACGREYWISPNSKHPLYGIRFVYLVNGQRNRVVPTLYFETADGSLKVYDNNVAAARLPNPFSPDLGIASNPNPTRTQLDNSNANSSSQPSFVTIEPGRRYQLNGTSRDRNRRYTAEILNDNGQAFINSIVLAVKRGRNLPDEIYNIKIVPSGTKMSITSNSRGTLAIERLSDKWQIRFTNANSISRNWEIPITNELKEIQHKKNVRLSKRACEDTGDAVISGTIPDILDGISEFADQLAEHYISFIELIRDLNEVEKEKLSQELKEQTDEVKNWADKLKKVTECDPKDTADQRPPEPPPNQTGQDNRNCTCTYSAEIHDPLRSTKPGRIGGFKGPCKASLQEVEAIIQSEVAANQQSVLQGTVQRTSQPPPGCGKAPVVTSFTCDGTGGTKCKASWGSSNTLTFTYEDEDGNASHWKLTGFSNQPVAEGDISPPKGRGGTIPYRGNCRGRGSPETYTIWVTVTDTTGLTSTPQSVEVTCQ